MPSLRHANRANLAQKWGPSWTPIRGPDSKLIDNLGLEAAINRLDRFDLLILDDLAYVTKDQAETRVLFELISARYERRSLLITANQPFGEWGKVFPEPTFS
jgi:DNA replication protein DnaC